MRLFLLFLILALSISAESQSRRVAPADSPARYTPASDPGQTVKQMFDEANQYIRTKGEEYDAKKIFVTDKLFAQTKLEQRQLAAKYATIAASRENLAGEDLYYLGLLHYLAGNQDGTVDAMKKFLASTEPPADRSQTARSMIVVISATQKKLEDAESTLAEYLKLEPKKLTEQARMEGELAKAYKDQKDFVRMAPHADSAYKAAKALLAEATSRARGLDEILDSGTLVFEAYRGIGDTEKAAAALDDMRNSAINTQSSSFFYYAVDAKIKFLIEIGRKPEALELYLASLAGISKYFSAKPVQEDAFRRLRARDTHYKILGEPSPELPLIDQWIPGSPKSIAGLKGKVVLLDFWATWCAPCLDAFPSIKEWHQEFSADGFEIIGVTRYYGTVNGVTADMPSEIEFLKRFKRSYALPYDFAVGKGQSSQTMFGALSLPTAVLIDRKGVIRYVATGTSPTRLEEIRATIVKLLAEK